MAKALYMGFDLSTQQLKGIVIESNLRLIHEAKVDFDADLAHHGVRKGVLADPAQGKIFAPVAMWLEALDLVLDRLREQGLDFGRVEGVSGAGMQHGTVFWSEEADALLEAMDGRMGLRGQLEAAFSRRFSPNWQDASTQKECDEFDGCLGGKMELAEATGSSAHHRFSGPQILRFRTKYPEAYEKTSRISLVSSFLASILLGKVAPIDISDVCGMNLWDIKSGAWNDQLIALAAGGDDGAAALKAKLGHVPEDGGKSFGQISPYFVSRYGFSTSCSIVPFTGDNPSTILALPLRESDAIVSLGTSTTFLMSTPRYKPDPSYHFMNHPATAGLYMFMLCYKNGGLAREQIRDALKHERPATDPWAAFNDAATSAAPLGQKTPAGAMKMGLYFPRPEIVPNVDAGTWRYTYEAATNKLHEATTADSRAWDRATDDARAIVESQFLSLRLRSQNLVCAQEDPNDAAGKVLPPQPRRIYLVGGGSLNPAIADLCGQVLGGSEGVYRLEIGGNACALGAAYKAAWACERGSGESFEELIGKRWHEDGFVKRVADGYRPGVWERCGEALKGFEMMERDVLAKAGAEN